LVTWQLFKRKERNELQQADNYHKVTAIINRVHASGINYKRSTLIQVSYVYKDEEQKATIRRNGFKKGLYKEGDSIVIYINPDNPDEVK